MSGPLSADDIFGRLAEGGWEKLLQAGGPDPRDSDKFADIALKAAACFATEPGREVLDYLLEITLRRATWPGDLNMPRDTLVNYGVFREGQNHVVALICTLIGAGEQAEAEARSDPDA